MTTKEELDDFDADEELAEFLRANPDDLTHEDIGALESLAELALRWYDRRFLGRAPRQRPTE